MGGTNVAIALRLSQPYLLYRYYLNPKFFDSCFTFQVSLNPVRILKHEAEEEKSEIARMSSFIGAIAIGDLVKSTLGPKGMDKILVSMGRNSGQV